MLYYPGKCFPRKLSQSTVKMLINKKQEIVEIDSFILNKEIYNVHVCHSL